MPLNIEQLYRGHFEECWEHFTKAFLSKYPPNSHGLVKAREPMRQFCRVNNCSIQRWMSGETTLPVGEISIRLMCYLDLHGYKIIEFERLQLYIRGIAETIGFSVMSAEEVGKYIGYSRTSAVYGLVREEYEPTPGIAARIRELWKNKKAEVENAKKIAFENLRLPIFSNSLPERMNSTPLLLPANFTGGTDSQVSATLSIMRGLLNLLETSLGELSDEEAVGLASDFPMILNLTSRLNAISAKIVASRKG